VARPNGQPRAAARQDELRRRAMEETQIGLYILICKLMDASFFPDAFLMVVVSNVLFVFAWFQIIAKVAST
jgi:hypothetical protein